MSPDENQILFDFPESKYKSGTLRIEVAIDKKVLKAGRDAGVKFTNNYHSDLAKAIILNGFKKKIVAVNYRAFTDKELGVVHTGYLPERFPIGKLKPIKYIDGKWMGDYFIIKKTQRSWLLEYRQKFHSGIQLICRSVGNGKIAVFRTNDTNKLPKLKVA